MSGLSSASGDLEAGDEDDEEALSRSAVTPAARAHGGHGAKSNSGGGSGHGLSAAGQLSGSLARLPWNGFAKHERQHVTTKAERLFLEVRSRPR